MENQDTVQTEKKKLLKRIPVIALVGLLAGAIGGYIYYLKVGCVSGTCAITSNPWMSAAWGGAFGYLIFDMFTTRKKKEKNSIAE
jgi:hypothetical protein